MTARDHHASIYAIMLSPNDLHCNKFSDEGQWARPAAVLVLIRLFELFHQILQILPLGLVLEPGLSVCPAVYR